MSDTAEQDRTHADAGHGFADATAAPVVADEAAPAHHPAEGPPDNPLAPGQEAEAILVDQFVDDFDDEVAVGGFAHQIAPIIGTIGKKMFQPVPLFTGCHNDPLCSGCILEVRRGQSSHQQAPVVSTAR